MSVVHTPEAWAWRRHDREVLRGLAVVAGLALLVAAVAAGQARLLLLALCGGVAGSLAIHWPLPTLLLALLLADRPLAFFGLPQPALLHGGGVEINALDALIVLTGAISLVKLRERREWPVFFVPVAALGAAILLSWLAGLVAGTTDLGSGLNGLRPLLAYLLYFSACGIIDTREKLRALVFMPFVCALVAVPFQFWSLLTARPGQGGILVIDGVAVPYQTLILVQYVILSAVFAFALLGAPARRGVRLLLIAVLGLALAGIALKFTRQLYVFAIVAPATILLLGAGRGRLRRLRSLLYLAALLPALLLAANAGLTPRMTTSPFAVIAVRGGEIFRPDESENVLARVESTRRMWQRIEDAPLFGVGPNQILGNDLSSEFYFTDVGFQSTLFFYGGVGLLGVAWVAGAIALRAFRRLRTLREQPLRAYLLGALGALAGMLVCYSLAQDYFTFTLVPVVFVLIVVDRTLRFSEPTGETASPSASAEVA